MVSRHGIVSAEASEDLRAVQTRLQAAPDELRTLLTATAADQLSRAWGEELDKQPATPQQKHWILWGTTATPSAAGLYVRTGDWLWPAFEFGTKDRDKRTTYFRRGGPQRRAGTVTRRTRRQLPEHKKSGHVAYPAANKLGTRVFHMWAELIRKVAGDAFDGGT